MGDVPDDGRPAAATLARMDGFTIRAVRPDDYERLGELTAAAYLDDGLLDYGAADPYLAVLRDVGRRAEHAEVLVAVDDAGTVLGGVAFVGAPGPFADVAREGEAEFRTLAVSPEGRGRGIGTALVRACIDRSRALGRCRVVLSTQPMMHAAHRVYERFGFTRAPERDWSPIDTLTLLVYELELETARD
jgi:ribosomal protein S18 acetylase RimI-like enzyme